MNGDLVDCEEILIRLISRRRAVLPNGEVATEVFLLRANENALSLFRKQISDIDVCKTALAKLHGAVTLHTGRIRDGRYPNGRQLEIIEAEGEGTEIPGHCALIGLPDPLKEVIEAERVASILCAQSRTIPL